MNGLVKIARSALGSLIGAAVLLTATNALTVPAEAAQAVAQPQLSFTCQFNAGPRAGQSQSYAGVPGIQAAPVGTYCVDGQGSTGVVVPDASVQPPAVLPPTPIAAAPETTFICRFNNGPRAGQAQSYAGVTGMQPMLIGTPCTDGQGSTGVAIAEAPVRPAAVQPPPTTSSTCQFNAGPRAGQIQSYAGVTGIQPMPIGAQCTDGQGSTGVAVPDPSVQPLPVQAPVAMQPPPVAVQPPVPVAAPPIAVQSRVAVQAPVAAQPPVAIEPTTAAQPPLPVRLPSHRTTHTRAAARAVASVPGVIPGAAVGAAIPGLSGAAWADPNNSGYVTGYVLNGRYHRGTPAGYDPVTHAVLPRSVASAAVGAAAAPILPISMVGTAVSGLAGAVWADANNDGVVDGYVYNGQYYPGFPPGYDSSAPPPPPPVAPSLYSRGERG